MVNGNATQLHQVLMNLAVNARDAMADGGTLGISAENLVLEQDYARMYLDAREGKYILITVSDTGVGISQSEQKHIFKPYFRSQKSRKNVPEGIGLGLAIVSQLVAMLEGKIELISEVNQGSTFIVIIPVDRESHHIFESNPENRT